jgi:hypothetical protein
VKARHNAHNLSFETVIQSRIVLEPDALQVLGLGRRPPNWGKGWGYRFRNGPIRKCNIGFLLAPHSDQSAISNRFAEPSNVTDRQAYRIDVAIFRPHAAR